ncbi:hypothetical protein KSF78_0005032 [Schistosoma japonicum]|uniref:Hypotheticial protein n=1 Tax=Schistosoma japonicum TaxID=6182 RepID=C1LLE4_SCHJA|nr:hypothetical protein KSF78_0005032 [Schistosoma japonicum]KAH8876710.1 hypothetical protein KSF78_0005032 [Schistosoma japonicum]CAX75522.1 hypotheticial protein [Schistosoma japonicum]
MEDHLAHLDDVLVDLEAVVVLLVLHQWVVVDEVKQSLESLIISEFQRL